MSGERTVVELLGDVAELLLADLDAIGDEMDAAEMDLAPVLRSDAAILLEMSASNRANVRRIFTALARRDGRPPPGDVPPEALDVARTIVRRGVDLDVLFQAYRRGQDVVWIRWMEYAARVVPPGPRLVELLTSSSRFVFEYVDQVLAKVIAEAQREREEVLGGALARRTETVRLILDGAPLDRRGAEERLGYRLTGAHTALVVWAEPAGEIHGVLESCVTLLAGAAEAHRPLTLPAGTSTLWAWLRTGSRAAPPSPSSLAAAMERAAPNVRVAVGPTRPGITGFRRSHAAALVVHGLLVGHRGGERLAFHHDLEVTALAARDGARAAEFVATTLGPLAEDTPSAARLRETVRVFLEEAENAPRAAARLHTHRNTVLQRVARASELLGHRPGDRRLAVELALELAHQIGHRVLVRR